MLYLGKNFNNKCLFMLEKYKQKGFKGKYKNYKKDTPWTIKKQNLPKEQKIRPKKSQKHRKQHNKRRIKANINQKPEGKKYCGQVEGQTMNQMAADMLRK